MLSRSRNERSDFARKAPMKLINPLNHPHSGKAAILIAIALVLGITVHEVFFLIALLIVAIACIEWGAHEVHVIHELHEHKTHSQTPRPKG
jgi:hypothetical protein